jgi:hypothetical protein
MCAIRSVTVRCCGHSMGRPMESFTAGIMQVGRPRPDFFYRCFPSGNSVFEDVGVAGLRRPKCSPKHPRHVIDGYKSFPSGEHFNVRS